MTTKKYNLDHELLRSILEVLEMEPEYVFEKKTGLVLASIIEAHLKFVETAEEAAELAEEEANLKARAEADEAEKEADFYANEKF